MELLGTLWDLVVHLDTHLESFVAQHGAWVYALLFAIVFCETGLVVTPFLPGDSLLFVAGAIAATGGMDIAAVIAALVAAIAWDLLTWYFGLPTSSSHALIFSIIGASVAVHGLDVIIVDGLNKTSFGIVYSPFMAFIGGYAFMLALYWLLRNVSYRFVNRFFGRAQILSSAYMAFSHGGNDGQKTMGVIALALAAYGAVPTGPGFFIPDWVKAVCAVSIGLGTASGGWRIIRTMGMRITALKPINGFAAETSAATVIEIATRFGIPISTTHAISGAILGVGATRRLSAVRWGIAGRIVTAWVLTIPSCFALGYGTATLLRAFGVHP